MNNNIVKSVADMVTNSNAHSDNQYVCVINEKGERVTSYILNSYNSNGDELMAKAQQQYPGMSCVLMGEEDWRQFVDEGKVYIDGQFVTPAPYVPTPAEVQTKAKRELDAEYQAQRKAMQEAMMTALLAGNDDALKGIREDCAALEEWYADELANIGKE